MGRSCEGLVHRLRNYVKWCNDAVSERENVFLVVNRDYSLQCSEEGRALETEERNADVIPVRILYCTLI